MDLKTYKISSSYRNGFSLVELMVALSLLMIGIFGFANGFLNVTNSSFFLQETLTRTELNRKIKNTLSDVRSLRTTVMAADNHQLKAAALNDFTGCVSSLNTHQFYDVSIYDSSGFKIVGPSSSPVYYTYQGFACPTGSTYGQGDCVVKVTSQFMIQSVPQTGSFDRMVTPAVHPSGYAQIKPEFIFITYNITFFDKPGVPKRKDANGAVFLNIADLGF